MDDHRNRKVDFSTLKVEFGANVEIFLYLLPYSMNFMFIGFKICIFQYLIIMVMNLPIKYSSILHNKRFFTSIKVSTLGIDFGTSGIRINIINHLNNIIFDDRILFKSSDIQSKELWITSINALLLNIPKNISLNIQAISLCGTSASCIILSSSGEVKYPVRMYDYDVISNNKEFGSKALARIQQYSPSGNAVNAATSTLAKLLTWKYESKILSTDRLAHQADVIISYLLHGSNPPSSTSSFISDWHNALKLGYDVQNLQYPVWLLELLDQEGIDQQVLPRVVEPGSVVGTINQDLSNRYHLPQNCKIVSGTTDSIAAFIATGVSQPGEAVTSLGSTTVLKLISTTMVQDSKRGIYSHRLMGSSASLWLVGGASNVGCSILRQENYSSDELEDLSKDIDSSVDSPLVYYPLCKQGERFPVNDPNKQPILEPKPSHERGSRRYRLEYLHGLLQGVAAVEVQGYQALKELGATPLTRVSYLVILYCIFLTMAIHLGGNRGRWIEKSYMDEDARAHAGRINKVS